MYSLLVSLTLITVASAAPVEATATRLDGTALAGELRNWDDEQVVVSAPRGDQRIAAAQLLSLRWSPGMPSGATESPKLALVELTDGSLLPAHEFRVVAGQAAVTLANPLPSDEQTLSMPARQIAAVRLQPLDAAVAAQWHDIRDQNLASDVLVVLNRDGKSLDYVEGVLGDLTPEKIEFTLDGEPIRADRANVAGFVFFRSQRRAEAEPRCVIHGRTGLRANVSHVRLTDGVLHLTTAGGVTLDWPLEDIHLADYSAGKLVYLSDIEPASERWTPLVGLPAGATFAAEYGQPRRDQSAFSGPLTLTLQDTASPAALDHTRSFNKGLAVRSRTELVYRLPARFRRFVALAGIEPATSASGNVRLAIHGDDRLLLEIEIAGDQTPLPIDLDIEGVKRLKIVVDYGQNLDTGDWLNLCDARIVK